MKLQVFSGQQLVYILHDNLTRLFSLEKRGVWNIRCRLDGVNLLGALHAFLLTKFPVAVAMEELAIHQLPLQQVHLAATLEALVFQRLVLLRRRLRWLSVVVVVGGC